MIKINHSTLESDKATMDVMADHEGVVQNVLVNIGQEVSEGTPVVMMEVMRILLLKTKIIPFQIHRSYPLPFQIWEG